MPNPNNPVHRLHVIITEDQYTQLLHEAARQSLANNWQVTVTAVVRDLIDRAFPAAKGR